MGGGENYRIVVWVELNLVAAQRVAKGDHECCTVKLQVLAEMLGIMISNLVKSEFRYHTEPTQHLSLLERIIISP